MTSTGSLVVEQAAALWPVDYSTLNADVATEMRERANRIRRLQRASVLDVGRELIAAKKLVEHGFFREWVETACQMQIRTAQRSMRVAELVEENDKLSYLPADGILALASRSAPQPVVKEIIAEIAAGERPSTAGIKRRITDAIKDGRRAHEQTEDGDELQHREPNPAEQEIATDELIDMLVTWHRIDEFMALLETADLSRVVHVLRDRRNRPDNRTVTEADPAVGLHPIRPMLETEAPGLPNYFTGPAAEAESRNDCAGAPAAATQPPRPETSSSVSAEELMALWSLLKPRSQWYGRQWVAAGAKHPLEHHVFTEALVPFRAAASKASDPELQRFLDLTVPQAA